MKIKQRMIYNAIRLYNTDVKHKYLLDIRNPARDHLEPRTSIYNMNPIRYVSATSHSSSRPQYIIYHWPSPALLRFQMLDRRYRNKLFVGPALYTASSSPTKTILKSTNSQRVSNTSHSNACCSRPRYLPWFVFCPSCLSTRSGMSFCFSL